MSMIEAYVERLQAQLDEWTAEIDKLKAKADQQEAEAKIEYYENIEALRVNTKKRCTASARPAQRRSMTAATNR